MKKLLLMAAVAVFGLSNVNAQEVKFGVKAGVNFASITGDFTDDLDGRTGFHVGGVAEIMISDQFSFQPELLYTAKGAKFTEEGVDVDIKYDYINLPLMAKYYVAENFSIEAGPQIGFLASAKFEAGSESLDVKDETSGIDFGLGIGVGYKLESGLNFAARYSLGLSNTNDFEGSDDFNQKNSVIQLSVGFMF